MLNIFTMEIFQKTHNFFRDLPITYVRDSHSTKGDSLWPKDPLKLHKFWNVGIQGTRVGNIIYTLGRNHSVRKEEQKPKH